MVKKFNWFYITVAATIAITVAIGVQNQRTYSFATNLAKETAACQVEFNEALKVRAAITADNDKWSRIQRTALADWIHDLIFPPVEIAMLDPDDPVRQAWGILRTQDADKVIREAQREQDKNQKEREAHPYPDPTCGKR